MSRALILCLWLAGLAGCAAPLKLVTDDRLAVVGPIKGNLTVELPPTSVTAGPVQEMPARDGPVCPGAKIALVDVDGLLLNANLTGPYSAGENPVDLFGEKLDAAAADPEVCALVVRINTPGGAVAATDMMWHELQLWRAKTGRPVVACLMDLATGGGYYLASAADLIVAHPQTVTGGFGVVLNLYNLEDFMGGLQIVPQMIKAGKNIDAGSMTRQLGKEERQLLQAMADEFHERFKKVVRQGRPRVDTAGAAFDGRPFTAQQALERGLIDQVGYLDDAVAAARQKAGLPQARVVLFHRRNDPAHSLYATTPNVPLQATLWPISLPGADRSRLPTFLYLWQPDPTLERLGGR
jgi:protease-4